MDSRYNLPRYIAGLVVWYGISNAIVLEFTPKTAI